MSSRTTRPALLLTAALLLTGCATEWEPVDGSGSPSLEREPAEQRQPIRAVLMPAAGPDDHVLPPAESDDEIIEGRWRHVGGPFQLPAVVVEARPGPVATPPPPAARVMEAPAPTPVRRTAPRLAIPPAARVQAPPAPVRAAEGPAALPDPRTHYLRNPTTIEAQAITLRVPRAWLSEVRGEGGTRTEGPKGAWRLTGQATVRLRELTLRGTRLTVIPVSKPDAPLSVMAKGGVDMVSRVGDRAIREEGANMIMITNARVVPLR